jgi:hypothetical protein
MPSKSFYFGASERNQLKGGKVHFGSVLEVSVMSPHFGPVVRQNIVTRSWWWSKAVHLITAGKRGQVAGREKIPGSQYPLQGPASVT